MHTMCAMRYALLALLLTACAEKPLMQERASDAPAVAYHWAQWCAPARMVPPMSGEDRFCPAVHDYIRSDAQVSDDAGATRAQALLDSCTLWVYCTSFEGCYHCADWSDYPGSL